MTRDFLCGAAWGVLMTVVLAGVWFGWPGRSRYPEVDATFNAALLNRPRPVYTLDAQGVTRAYLNGELVWTGTMRSGYGGLMVSKACDCEETR